MHWHVIEREQGGGYHKVYGELPLPTHEEAFARRNTLQQEANLRTPLGQSRSPRAYGVESCTEAHR